MSFTAYEQSILDAKYLGAMQIIEGIQYGIDFATILNRLSRSATTDAGSAMFLGAVGGLHQQFNALRKAGISFTSKDPSTNDFLQLPPYTMAAELTRLMNGGEATKQDFTNALSIMAGAVWANRKSYVVDGKRLAVK